MQPAAAKDEGCPDKDWFLRLGLRGEEDDMVCTICLRDFRRGPSGVRNGGWDRLVLRFGERGTASLVLGICRRFSRLGKGICERSRGRIRKAYY